MKKILYPLLIGKLLEFKDSKIMYKFIGITTYEIFT